MITCFTQEELQFKAKLIQSSDIKRKTERTTMKPSSLENKNTKHLRLKSPNSMKPQPPLMMLWLFLLNSQTHHCYKLEDSKIHSRTLKIRSDQDLKWHQWSRLWLHWLPTKTSPVKMYYKASLMHSMNSETLLLIKSMIWQPKKHKMLLTMKLILNNWMTNSVNSEDKLIELQSI